MTFALSMHSVRAVRSYTDAVEFYKNCTPWVNGGDDRPFKGKRARHMGVRIENDAVIFRYHRTDVVTWHSDDTCEVDVSYGSRSTDAFADNFMPARHSLSRESTVLRVGGWVDGVVYPVQDSFKIGPDGTVHTDVVFQRSVHKPAETRAMLKEMGYYDYLAWHKLMCPMVEDTLPAMWNREKMTARDALTCMMSEHGYHRLMTSASGMPKTIREIACSFYGNEFDIYEVETRETLPSSDQVRRGKWLIESR